MSMLGEIANNVIGLVREWVPDKDKQMEMEIGLRAAFMEHEAKMGEQISARHIADMQSDNKLAKNIRPAMLIISAILWLSENLAYMWNETVFPADLSSTNKWVLLSAVSFYFGGRSIEKILSKFGGRK